MADVIMDGYWTVWLVPTIPNINAPVAATIAAGTDISLSLTRDGLAGFATSTNWVDTSALGSTFSTKRPGTVDAGDMSLTFKWQAGADALFNLLVFGYETNVVVRRRILRSTAVAASQLVQVYPIACGQYTGADFESNTVDRFTIPVGPSLEPALRAVVA